MRRIELNKKNISLFTMMFFFSIIEVKGQYHWQYGISIGTMKYDGDVGSVNGNGFSSFTNPGSSPRIASLYI